MTTSVREQHARLLADVRRSEPRARLAQAASRSSFLLRVSRTVSAIQNSERALAATVSLLLEEMVDVAQVVVRAGAWQMAAAGFLEEPVRSASTRWVDDVSPAFEAHYARPVIEDIVVPTSGARRTALLAEVLVDEKVRDAVEPSGVEHLVTVPLTARGRTFGMLVLGRDRGFGFAGTHAFLEDLAERIAVGLDTNLLIAESQYVASVLRRSLAPSEPPEIPGLGVATYYRVAHQSEQVGGDFIDAFERHDDVLVLCGDVAGKGVEAAVAAKRIRNAVRTASMVDTRPDWILELVNRLLLAEAGAESEQLATVVLARLRREGDRTEVRLANAGHPAAHVVRADGALDPIAPSGVALALIDRVEYDQVTTVLEPGDTLVLHTDGVTEARGGDDLFGEERLRAQLRRVAALPPSAMVESVAVQVSEHIGDRVHDDIAIMAVQVQARPE